MDKIEKKWNIGKEIAGLMPNGRIGRMNDREFGKLGVLGCKKMLDCFVPNLIFVENKRQKMTKIIFNIERSEDAKLLEAFAQKLGLTYAYQTEPDKTIPSVIPDEQWIKTIEGSWNDFSDTAEEMIALIEGSRTLGRTIEML